MKINPPIYIMLTACDSSCAYLAPNALELLYLFIFLPKMFSVTSAVPGNCYITRICTSSKVTTILPISQLQLHHHTTAFPLDVPSSARRHSLAAKNIAPTKVSHIIQHHSIRMRHIFLHGQRALNGRHAIPIVLGPIRSHRAAERIRPLGQGTAGIALVAGTPRALVCQYAHDEICGLTEIPFVGRGGRGMLSVG